MVALLLPALRAAKESVNSAACMSNLRQLYLATTSYAAEYDGFAPPYSDAGPTGLHIAYLNDFILRLMPYLGYNGTPEQYFADTYNHGNLEIRSAGGIGSYKTTGNMQTKTRNVWYCPSTRGSMNIWIPLRGSDPDNNGTCGCSYNFYIDYGINGYLSGSVDANGNWISPSPPRIGMNNGNTSPAKLIYMSDASGYWATATLPSNRHYATGVNTAGGRCNAVFWDGHTESCPHLANVYNWLSVPPGVYCQSTEKNYPGWKYYLIP